jgi:hypothetical protein
MWPNTPQSLWAGATGFFTIGVTGGAFVEQRLPKLDDRAATVIASAIIAPT